MINQKKILITGVTGQVGHALASKISGFKVYALSKEALDLTREDEIRRVVREIHPDFIINPAAYTAVDQAESEPALAYAINAVAPRVLAEEAAKIKAAIIHFSTDYVYDGSKATPYIETDQVNPVSSYGKSKLAGDIAITDVGVPHLILRTSWVYGLYGRNFLLTMLRLAKERESLKIVADQQGAPTSSLCIANAVAELLKKWETSESKSGVYHLTNAGSTSWHGFTCEIIKAYLSQNGQSSLMAKPSTVTPLTTKEYPTPAARPANSVLDNSKLAQVFGVELKPWKESLQQVLKQMEINTN